MPATIDDPAILDEITGVMSERGMVKGASASTWLGSDHRRSSMRSQDLSGSSTW